MAVALADLVSRLEDAVPANNGTPSSAQYTQAVKDAVNDLSDRAALRKRAAISMVSGTASYELPADFLGVIRLESLLSPDSEALITPSGIIPVSSGFKETFTIAGQQITFYPTPNYNAARYLWYRAGYVLNSSDVYADLTDTLARIVMLKAQAICLGLQANKTAQEAWQYQLGDERVSKERLSEALAKQATALEKEYKAALEAEGGPIGMRPYTEKANSGLNW